MAAHPNKGQEPEEPSEWTKSQSAFNAKQYSEYFDPCQEAANKSMKCLHRNGGDKDLCTDYFQAYKDCKKRWIEERQEAKRLERLKRGSWFG